MILLRGEWPYRRRDDELPPYEDPYPILAWTVTLIILVTLLGVLLGVLVYL